MTLLMAVIHAALAENKVTSVSLRKFSCVAALQSQCETGTTLPPDDAAPRVPEWIIHTQS